MRFRVIARDWLPFLGWGEYIDGDWQNRSRWGPLGQLGNNLGLYRVIWGQMDVSVAKRGNQLVSLGLSKGQWGSMKIDETQLGSVGVIGTQWGISGDQCTMYIHPKLIEVTLWILCFIKKLKAKTFKRTNLNETYLSSDELIILKNLDCWNLVFFETRKKTSNFQ